MIKFIEKDQIWQNETINYWFDVDGIMYALSDCNDSQTLLDYQGYPIDACNDTTNVLDQLINALTADINR